MNASPPSSPKARKVVVGLSGGVDSSVTAYLLKEAGHHVHGVFMQNWEDDNNDEYCSIKEDSLDAMAVADIIGIDIDIVNFAAQYKDKVFAYFLQEYQAGRTPNPCVRCNRMIKFGALYQKADELGASGHPRDPFGNIELRRLAEEVEHPAITQHGHIVFDVRV